MIPRVFIEDVLKKQIVKDPCCMAQAKVREKSIVLDIEGSGGGQWSFDFDQAGALSLGTPQSTAACTIWMKDTTFEQMIDGDLNVPFAFMMRKIKVKGEMSLAADVGLALQKLFAK